MRGEEGHVVLHVQEFDPPAEPETVVGVHELAESGQSDAAVADEGLQVGEEVAVVRRQDHWAARATGAPECVGGSRPAAPGGYGRQGSRPARPAVLISALIRRMPPTLPRPGPAPRSSRSLAAASEGHHR